MRLALSATLALVTACIEPQKLAGPTSDDPTSTGPVETTAETTGTEGTEGSGADATTPSTGSTSSSSSGGTTSSDSSGSEGETSSSTESDTGSSSTTGEVLFCGDSMVTAGEECDDGNLADGDGCSAACVVERWTHEGVATDVPIADLKKWKPCFTSTYEAGPKAQDILDACDGDHILMGCRPVDGTALTIAAHAPRADVFFEPQVNYDKGERHVANGVAWYWAPYYGLIGFEPHLGNDWWYPCSKPDQVEQMCWLADSVQMAIGYRCGGEVISGALAPPKWLRVAYEAWD